MGKYHRDRLIKDVKIIITSSIYDDFSIYDKNTPITSFASIFVEIVLAKSSNDHYCINTKPKGYKPKDFYESNRIQVSGKLKVKLEFVKDNTGIVNLLIGAGDDRGARNHSIDKYIAIGKYKHDNNNKERNEKIVLTITGKLPNEPNGKYLQIYSAFRP